MRKLLLGCASVAAIALSPAAAAQAQTKPAARDAVDTTEVGEVLVTARKRAERLRDVPVAATVIDTELVANRGGVPDVETMLSTVPGLRYFNTSTPANSEISLRSSGTSRGTSAEAAVGLYRNGAYIGGGGNLGGRNFTSIDLFDIGRIEVLRGTQGALYGRNAVGGAINVISAAPVNRYAGYADVKYGISNERLQTQAVVNIPINDNIATRFGVNYVNQTDGFFYNPTHDKFFDEEHTTQMRGQVKFTEGRFDLTVLGEAQVSAQPTLYYQGYILPDPTSTTLPKGLIQDKYNIPWSSSPTAKQNVTTINVSSNYAAEAGTLTTTLMYRKRKSLSSYDSDLLDAASLAIERARGNNPADANMGNENHNLAKTLYGDIHFASGKAGPLNYLAGFEYLRIKSNQNNYTTRTPTKANTSVGQITSSTGLIKSASAYASVGYAVTSALSVTGEARYTRDDRQSTSARFDRGTLLPVTAGNLTPFSQSKPSNFTFNTNAAYHFNSNWLGYAKVGTGFRAGGFNNSLGDPRQPVPIPSAFNDEKSITYEVGAKGNLTPNIYTTFAAYTSTIKDFLVQQNNGCLQTNPVCPVASTSFLINGGRARTWGLEADMTGRFDVSGGVLRTDISIGRQGGKVVAGPYDGLRIPQSPDWNGSLAVNYRHDLASGFVGFANANYQFQTGGVQEIEGTPRLYDHGTADVRVGVDYQRWEAAFIVTNVTNFDYILNETVTTRRWNQPHVYSVQLRYAW